MAGIAEVRVREYWKERVDAGKIFTRAGYREGFHYIKRGRTDDWPTYVSKAALHNDYLAWARKYEGASLPVPELYRLLEPLIYPHGRAAHTRRFKVAESTYVGEQGMLSVKKPHAFIRLAPWEVYVAHYGLVTGCGTLTQRTEWAQTVAQNREVFCPRDI